MLLYLSGHGNDAARDARRKEEQEVDKGVIKW